jgi:hypothetical protein
MVSKYAVTGSAKDSNSKSQYSDIKNALNADSARTRAISLLWTVGEPRKEKKDIKKTSHFSVI